jgi:hypothetical protein
VPEAAASSSGRKFVVTDDCARPTPIRIGDFPQDQQGGLAGEPFGNDNRALPR